LLAKRVIPCLDVKGGRVVKGTRFLGLRDAGDPVELASRYDRENADELVFLDITASSDKRSIMIDLAARVADEVFIPFTVGGGIRTIEDMRAILRAGADKISVNTRAVEEPTILSQSAELFGSQCVVLAVDAKRVEPGARWEVYIHGGRTPTGMDVLEWVLQGERMGAGEILLTSMDTDGTKAGYDVELCRAVSEAVSVPVIASGGGGNLEHIHDVLTRGKADAVLAASIFHYGEISIGEVKSYLKEKGVPVRV